MSTSTCLASTSGSCRYCRFFTPEGRRGGYCNQLGVPVQSKWKACMLALPPFAPSWETLEQSISWQPQGFIAEKERALDNTSSGFKTQEYQKPSKVTQPDVASMLV